MRVKKLKMRCMKNNMLNSEQRTLTERDTLRIRLCIKYQPSLDFIFHLPWSPKHHSLFQGTTLSRLPILLKQSLL